jgi:hypothetical protein
MKDYVSLDEFFGERPINEALVQGALKGARDVMLHLAQDRVMVLKRGQRVDKRLLPTAEAEVLRAYRDGSLMDLMPRNGRNSASLRIRR